MASLEYLLTLLPSLPNYLGDKVSIEDVYRLIKFEDNTRLNYLVDVLSSEDEINNCGLQYFVLQNKSYNIELSQNLPESFKNTFFSFNTKSESEWMTDVYAEWFNMLILTSSNIGSSLLAEWAKWEYSLRLNFMIDRFKKSNEDFDESDFIPDFLRFEKQYDTDYVVEAYNKCSEPMEAEKTVDQLRLDFIRSLAISYSFSADELIAYMLELRIFARYARLDPEKGRKILQEVTAL